MYKMLFGYMPKVAHVVPVQRGILPHVYVVDIPKTAQSFVLPDTTTNVRAIDVVVDLRYHKIFHVTPKGDSIILTPADVPFKSGDWQDEEKKIWKVDFYSLVLYSGDFKKISAWRKVVKTDRVCRPNVGLNITTQDVQFWLEKPEKVWPYEYQ